MRSYVGRLVNGRTDSGRGILKHEHHLSSAVRGRVRNLGFHTRRREPRPSATASAVEKSNEGAEDRAWPQEIWDKYIGYMERWHVLIEGAEE